jgi:hypothetical protein
VAGLLIVRATNRNRAVVRDLGHLLAARFSSGPAWLRALTTASPIPPGDGLLWSASESGALSAARGDRRAQGRDPRPAPPRWRRPRPRGTAGSGT